ncbi:MAG: VOC family protein [Gemmatimonadales bacterium]
MSQRLALVAVLVRDYDEAIRYFTTVLGFELLEDSPRSDGRRWVVVGPAGSRGANLLLAKASSPVQSGRIGDQTGGRVFLFLHSSNFAADHAALAQRGVRFLEAPRDEPYGTVAVFEDLYGNKWDLIQPKPLA